MLDLLGADISAADAYQNYHTTWLELMKQPALEGFDKLAIPTTVSWKVKDKITLYAILEHLSSSIEQVHVGTVNERYIASAVFHNPFVDNISILKVLERRAGSEDPLGLDSIDYMVNDIETIANILDNAKLNYEVQSNTMHEWLSLRFGASQQHEAKFVNHLVLEVAVKEMQLRNKQLLKNYNLTLTNI